MKTSGSPLKVKIDEKKDHHPIICNSDEMNNDMTLFKPSSIKHSKDYH